MSDFLDLQGAKDLNTDAIHIGAVANSKDPATGAPIDAHVNRVGGTDYTLDGLYKALGPVVMPWTSVTGGTLTQPNQAFLHPTNGNYYSWGGAYPAGGYVVAPGTDPTAVAGYVPRVDVALRNELASSVSGKGSALIESESAGNLESFLASHNFLTVEQFSVINDFNFSTGSGTDNRHNLMMAIAAAKAQGKLLISANGGNIGISGELEIDVPIDLMGATICQISKTSNTVKLRKNGRLLNGSVFHNMSTGKAVTVSGQDGIFISRNQSEIIDSLRIYSSDTVQPISAWVGKGLVLEAIGAENYISGVSINAVVQGFEYPYYEQVTGSGFINSNDITLNINLFKHAVTIESSIVGREYMASNSVYRLNIQPQSGALTAMTLACANSKFYGNLWDGASMANVSRAVNLVNAQPASPFQTFVTCKGNYIAMFGVNEDRCVGKIETNTIANPVRNNPSKIAQPFRYNYGSDVELRRNKVSPDGTTDTLHYSQAIDNYLFKANKTNLYTTTRTNVGGTNLGTISPTSGSVDNIFNYDTKSAIFSSTDYVTITVSLKEVGSSGGLNYGETILDAIGFITYGTVNNVILEVRFAGNTTWTRVFESYDKPISRVMTRFNPESGDTNTIAPANIDGVRFRLQASSGTVEIRELMAMAENKIGHSVISGSSPRVVDGDLTIMEKGKGFVLFDSETGVKYRLIVTNGALSLYAV